jgi:nucleoside-diphosphate-sugar epimerase
MKVAMVTGATGFLGRNLTARLAENGVKVHALYRSEEKIRDWNHENIEFFRGSLTDRDSLENAISGCDEVHHLAAYASPWARDNDLFYRENVGGTINILQAAKELGVKKMVYVSTAGVLGPSNGGLNTENKKFTGTHFTHYDCSKAMAEEKVKEFANSELQAVIVNPTRIFGPGVLSSANSLTVMIRAYLEGKWKVIPGNGQSMGNYVFVEDVVDCILMAMEKGKSGERYLAGGENLSFNKLFEIIATVSGKKYRLYRMPQWIMMLAAGLIQGTALLAGKAPRITPSFVRRYQHNWAVSTKKAEDELGYRPLRFEEGLKKTIEWIMESHTH